MKTAKLTLDKVFPFLLIIGGAIALFASFILTHDTLSIDKNPHFIPSCNLNPVLSCGDVITAKGDTILGLPYPFYGIAVFAVLIALGASLLAGAKFKKWYWQTYEALLALGTIGAYYLLFKSMYTIHALCPFCLSVDVATTTIFWYSTLYVIDNKTINLKGKRSKKIYSFVRAHHLDILILWFILVIAFILHHFWYYYGKHL
jgi:uncharacterized membrane protein